MEESQLYGICIGILCIQYTVYILCANLDGVQFGASLKCPLCLPGLPLRFCLTCIYVVRKTHIILHCNLFEFTQLVCSSETRIVRRNEKATTERVDQKKEKDEERVRKER